MNKVDCLVIYGPSGVGKSTIISKIMEIYFDIFDFTISHTSRPIRIGENDGINYYFVCEEKINDMIKNNEFIEYTKFADNYYGTSKTAIDIVKNNKKVCILDLDINGIKSMKGIKEYNSLYVYIAPPSIDELKKRLKFRGEQKESITKRIDQAINDMNDNIHELFNKVIINDNLQMATTELKQYIETNITKN